MSTGSSTSCETVRDTLLAGRAPNDAALGHAETCEQCADLLADGAVLGRALAVPRETGVPARDLWSSVELSVNADAGPRAWLRSRPTRVRVTLGLVGALLVVGLGTAHLRRDFATLPMLPVGAWVVLFVLVALGVIRLTLATLAQARPEASQRRLGRTAALALALPAAYALGGALTLGASSPRDDRPFLEQALACFGYGALLSLPLALILWLLDRGAGPRGRLLSGAAATGLAANAALLLHCSASDPAHIFAGHVTVGLALALGAWLVSTRERSA